MFFIILRLSRYVSYCSILLVGDVPALRLRLHGDCFYSFHYYQSLSFFSVGQPSEAFQELWR